MAHLFRTTTWILLLTLFLSVAVAAKAATPATVILVRHGEKAAGDGDVPLTSLGQERAQALAKVLADANVSAIYTSRAKRTQDTASPLAERLHVATSVIPKGQIDEVVKRLRATSPGKTVLLVWHVDELPNIVEKVGGRLASYGDQEYDRLVILTLMNGKVAQLLTLRYGR